MMSDTDHMLLDSVIKRYHEIKDEKLAIAKDSLGMYREIIIMSESQVTALCEVILILKKRIEKLEDRVSGIPF